MGSNGQYIARKNIFPNTMGDSPQYPGRPTDFWGPNFLEDNAGMEAAILCEGPSTKWHDLIENNTNSLGTSGRLTYILVSLSFLLIPLRSHCLKETNFPNWKKMNPTAPPQNPWVLITSSILTVWFLSRPKNVKELERCMFLFPSRLSSAGLSGLSPFFTAGFGTSVRRFPARLSSSFWRFIMPYRTASGSPESGNCERVRNRSRWSYTSVVLHTMRNWSYTSWKLVQTTPLLVRCLAY